MHGPSANVNQSKRHSRFAHERIDTCTQDDVANHQMQLVNQAMRQQKNTSNALEEMR